MVWGIHTIAGILPFAVENYCNLNTVGKFFTFFLSCLVIPTLKFNCLVQLKKIYQLSTLYEGLYQT